MTATARRHRNRSPEENPARVQPLVFALAGVAVVSATLPDRSDRRTELLAGRAVCVRWPRSLAAVEVVAWSVLLPGERYFLAADFLADFLAAGFLAAFFFAGVAGASSSAGASAPSPSDPPTPGTTL